MTEVNYAHGIDMQQVFAQAAVAFHEGEPWWLTRDEEALLEAQNQRHRAVSAIHDRVVSALDLDRSSAVNLPAMTPTELLIEIGIRNPTNPQCKECAAILRDRLGDSKRINGQNKWRIPLRRAAWLTSTTPDDDDLY